MQVILAQINPRTFLFSTVSATAIIFAVIASYAIWPQVKDYRSLKTDLHSLEMLVENSNDKTNIEELKHEVELARRQLKGDMANLPNKEMEAYIIGVLQNISWNNEIDLIGVKPKSGNDIHIFQELLFEVKVSGDYFDLYKWFIELRKSLGFVVIKKLNLSPRGSAESKNSLFMDLTIASYKSENS